MRTASPDVRSRGRLSAALMLLGACGDLRDESSPGDGEFGSTQDARAFLDSAEARVWTEHVPSARLRRLADSLHACGVPEVFFADIVSVAGLRVSARFVARLPVAGESRRRALAAIRACPFDGEVVDDGQEYVDLSLD